MARIGPSTLLNYRSVLNGYILPEFGAAEVSTISKRDVRAWLGDLMKAGKSAELVNRIIRVLRTVLFYAVTDLEVLERNVMLRFKQYEGAAARLGRQPVWRALAPAARFRITLACHEVDRRDC